MSIFDEVHVISKYNYPIPIAEVEKVEAELGIRLPEGYRGFITRFGAGVYCDLFRIYTPQEILEKRNRWQKIPYFWSNSEGILNAAELQASHAIGDSIDGDEIVFYLQKPENIFMMPRHSSEIVALQADFSDLHLWEREPLSLLKFETWEKRAKLFYDSLEFSIDQLSCVQVFKKQWDKILLADEEISDRGWYLNFCVPVIGADIRVDVSEDLISEEHDNPHILRGYKDDEKHIGFQIDCDEDSVEEVKAFFDSLEAKKLIRFS
jgi:hypothetical protein